MKVPDTSVKFLPYNALKLPHLEHDTDHTHEGVTLHILVIVVIIKQQTLQI